MRAVIVAAVSTGAQASEERYSIPQQLDLCRGMCAQRAWQVVGEITIAGHSRAYNWLDELCADCAEYGNLLRTIRADATDLVVCRDYDRLWRTDALRAQLMAVCREHRVQIYALNQPVEPVDPALLAHSSDSSLIITAVSGVVSQLENESRKRRTMAGLRGRVARGLPPGAAKPRYGYARVDKHLVVNEAEARWVRWIHERYAEGQGAPALTFALNDMGIPGPTGGRWHRDTVRHIIAHPVYAGMVRYGDILTKGQHEAIVSPELWQRCHDAQQRRHVPQMRNPAYILSGLVRCGYCGGALTYATPHHGIAILRCATYAHWGGRQCQVNSIRAVELEGYVLYQVKAALDNPLAFAEAQRVDKRVDESAELATYQAAYVANADKWARWDRLYEAGGIDANELLTHRAEIQAAQQALQARITAIESIAQREASRHNRLVELASTLDTLDTLPPERLSQLYRLLIARVIVHRAYPPCIEWL
ncbi:MAG: recombinase family protein [bacterium]